MSRLTLRLPDSLHRQLSDQAKQEGISLNQYIVYALTREATVAYTVRPVSDTASQKVAYAALLEKLGRASFDEIRAVLDERESVEPEDGLSADVIARMKQKLSSSK
ncbi:MAG: toxin-antitoxin system HicB family antitoxin [Gemmatimonadetes bacterium]|nr:toxin-antitoxin system HicB family antitoxin [Gemmatimonadota bacterium]MYF16248.1 toxin-antitoxin system HicB family antitoxin [Gemmatimonadota bacterium]